ncbi:MAG: SDR family NAD(P)-dependent oxidoreductase [Bacteroidales bacterium]|nr:SDR family NAD(P)-dependent oxidoreductase [Bacteroidales bacterium]
MNNPNRKYALVTGASRGIGKAMAHELALRKINLLLVSLKGEGLDDFCEEIRDEYGVDAQYFETDFYQFESVYDVAHWAITNYNPYILINNAGIGGTKAFESVPPEYIDAIIQVNIRATSLLTRLLLPELKKQKKAYILNVASMAAFSPFAFKTVYPASKAFVYSFSEGLREELKGTNVFISVILPGPVKTNADVTARIEKQGILGRVGLLSPQELAGIAIRKLLNQECFILPGILNKINWILMTVIPNTWKLTVLSRVVRKEINTCKPVIPMLRVLKQ